MLSTSLAERTLTGSMSVVLAGALIGTLVGVGVTMSPLAVALPLAGLLVLLPVFVLEDVKTYWLSLFLVAAHLGIAKQLLDGLVVLDSMGIDYGPFVFTPEIRAGDLPFLALLVLWLDDLRLGRATLHLPAVTWLALGFLGCCAASLLWAPSRYLAAIELMRQAKFALIFLYAANNLGAKRTLRWVWLLILFMVLLQGGVTIFRFTFGYYGSFFGELFGRAGPTMTDAQASLASEGWMKGLRNSFGTSPGATTSQLLLLGLPFVTFAWMRNPLFKRGFARALPFGVGVTALLLTFSRSSVVAGMATLGMCYAFAVRRGYLARTVALGIGMGTAFVITVTTPMVTEFMTRKLENVDIRLEQYTTAIPMIRDHALLGVGLNNSTGEAQTYARYSTSMIDPRNNVTDTPIHSFPMTLLVEVGIVGFTFYFAFFTAVALTAWRLAHSPVDQDDTCSAMAFLLGMIGLGLGVLTNPLFDDGVQTFLWLYAGAIVAIGHRVAESPTVPKSPFRPAQST